MTSPPAAIPFDREGDADDTQRVERALHGFVRDFGRTAALYLETCVHCGFCAEACHFYEVTKEAKYTPVWKIEPLKQAYKREYGPFAPIYRWLNLKPKITIAELGKWQELIYDSCTLCGRCSLVCPMGIDIAGLIGEARHGMAAAGLVPHDLWALAADADGSKQEDREAAFVDRIAAVARESGLAIPLDKARADVVCTLSSSELDAYPNSILAITKVMNHIGADWTFRSDGYEASNIGIVTGDMQRQAEISLPVIEAAVAAGAKLLIVPECGHAYAALRWHGAEMYGAPLPFAVQHISEFLADRIGDGTLALTKVEKSATFHDPCQISRRGGAGDAPRKVLAALGVELREMHPTADVNWCCGGGGGVSAIRRADALRYKAFRLKMDQIEATEAELPVTSCNGCRHSFEDGAAHFDWNKRIYSLLELVADNLPEGEG